ncbi:MAG: secondary thiamine-phosphate synthase enzyme YjbQ [Pseudomonadota bacterium]
MNTEFAVQTRGPGFTEITPLVARWLRGVQDGAAVLMIRHTSASLLIQENADPDVQTDLLAWLERIAPSADHPDMAYLRHRSEGPDDMPAHLRAAVLPTSLHIPVRDGQMQLGTWQGIYVVEHRARPHHRRVVATFLGA